MQMEPCSTGRSSLVINSLISCKEELAEPTAERDLFREQPRLRSEKRDAVLQFLQDTHRYCAILLGPPGSLKTASVKWAARQTNMITTELQVDGQWTLERMRNEMNRAIGTEWLSKDVRRKLTIVYGADLEILPLRSLDGMIDSATSQTSTKFILEVNEITPVLYNHLASRVKLIKFAALNTQEMQYMLRFFLAETNSHRRALPAPKLESAISAKDLLVSCQGCATLLEHKLRFACDAKDVDDNPMMDASKVLSLHHTLP